MSMRNDDETGRKNGQGWGLRAGYPLGAGQICCPRADIYTYGGQGRGRSRARAAGRAQEAGHKPYAGSGKSSKSTGESNLGPDSLISFLI